MVVLLAEAGAVTLKEIVLDGTKIEANANRYTFVWGKAIKVSRERIGRQLGELWEYVEKVYENEEQQPNEPANFKQINPQAVSETIDRINETLKDKEIDPKVKQKLNYAKKNWPVKLKEYEERERQLAGRNSLSKTDPDATFMRMKDDHMRNGQLKPGYNVQASTDKHYILNYTLGQTTADTTLLKDHIEDTIESYGEIPESLTADAGYGSEENYDFLEEKGITAFVKYGYFDKEIRDRKYRENPFNADNLHYNCETDTYTCPIGQSMKYIGDRTRKTANGFIQTHRLYQGQKLRGLPDARPLSQSGRQPHHSAFVQPQPPPQKDKRTADERRRDQKKKTKVEGRSGIREY